MRVLSKLDMGNNSIENARFELVPTIPNGVEDNIVKIGASGALVDSGVSISEVGGGGDMSNYYTKTEVDAALDEKQDVIADLADIRSGAALGATALQEHQDISGKQDVLVSGTNIKTINNQSLLGDGNITIEGGGGSAVQSDWEQNDSSADDFIKHKPDLSGYVTESYVYEMGFVTSNEIADFVTESDVANYLTENNYTTTSDIPDVSDFVTESHIYEMGFVTNSDIADFITESDVANYLSNEGYVTSSDLSNFITETDVANYLSNEGYVTNSDLSNFITETDVAEYLSSEGYMTQSDVADYLSNEAYVTESFLSDTGYVTEEFLSTNEYINASNIEDAISTYLSDFITGDVLVKYVTEIDAKPNYATVEITDTDTQGSYTYTIDTSSLNVGALPIVQVTYNGQVLFTDITVTIDSSNSEIVVTWDDTKYSVDSNNPLTVVIIGQAPAQ